MKKIILLSSVLKPVTEPRMYEKLGKTLRLLPQYDVHIFGAMRNQTLFLEQVNVHEHTYYTRSKFSRIRILIQYLRLIFRIKPSILVPSTLDLCILSIFYRFFNYNVIIVYDMRENFSLNTKFHTHYSIFISFLVQKIELSVLNKSNGVVYAEKVYQNQFDLNNKSICIENLPNEVSIIQKITQDYPTKISFLYSGNMTKEYGLYEVIFFYEKVKVWFPNVHLTIIGNCLDQKVKQELKDFFIQNPEVKYSGIDKAASHQEILAEIKKADFGLVSYQKNKAFDGKYPTKVYEYLQARLPMLLFEDQTWNELVLEYDAGIMCTVQYLTKEKMQYILEKQYFQTDLDTSKFTWENQESRLLDFFNKF